MAYDPNQQDPNAQAQATPQNQLMTSSAPGAGPGASTGKGASPQSAPAQPFQNLSAYLGANQPQVQAQAGSMATDLGNQFNKIQSDVTQAKSDFGNQVQSGYAAPNAGVTDKAAADPTGFASDPNNVKAFKSLYNDNYSGPTNFESTGQYRDLTKETTSAKTDADNVMSTGGIQNYFQSKNPNATQGGNMLDTVLLQGSPDAYKKVTDAAKPFSTLPDFLSGAVSEADQGVSTAQRTAANTAKATQDRFTGANGVIPTFQNDLSSRLNAARTGAQSSADALKSDFLYGGSATPQPKLSADDYKALGLSAPELEPIFGAQQALLKDYKVPVNLSSTLTTQDPSVVFQNANSIANSGDYAKMAALSQLTGQDMTSFLDPAQAGNAGKINPNLVNFDLAGARSETTDALRTQDMSFLNKIPNNSGKDIMTLLQDPANVATVRSQLPADQQAIFDDVAQRMGFTGRDQPTVSQPFTPITDPLLLDPNTNVGRSNISLNRLAQRPGGGVTAFSIPPSTPTPPTNLADYLAPTPAVNTPLAGPTPAIEPSLSTPKPAIGIPLAPLPATPPVTDPLLDPNTNVGRSNIAAKKLAGRGVTAFGVPGIF